MDSEDSTAVGVTRLGVLPRASHLFEWKGPVGRKGHKYGGWFNLGMTVAGHTLHVDWAGCISII